MKNEEDYAYVLNEAFVDNRDLEARDHVLAQMANGAKLEESLISEFRGTIIIEHPKAFNDNLKSEMVLEHEERHIINGIINSEYVPERLDGFQKYSRFIKGNKQEFSEDIMEFFKNNSQIEVWIKDEISAYFQKEDIDPVKLSLGLLKNKTIYDYAYDYDLGRANPQKISSEYIKKVCQAIIAFSKLREAGYSSSVIQGVLFLEPLDQWLKTATKILGEKINFSENLSKYISPIIIKKLYK